MRVRWFLGTGRGSGGAPLQHPEPGGRRAIVPAEVEMVVPSRTGGDPHHVRSRNGSWSCTCKAYTKGSKDCWAIKETRAGLTQVKQLDSLAVGGGAR